MRLLLDTHALLWWLLDSPKLPERWRAALATSSSEVQVSAASIWEIAIKASSGKLKLPEGLELASLPERCGFDALAVTPLHAAAVARLPWHHRDPFDRILVAQSQLEDLRLVSLDSKLAMYDVGLL